ncbi:hypothetical protein VULLAG_LOCUS10213 [Vulpes lagopus]
MLFLQALIHAHRVENGDSAANCAGLKGARWSPPAGRAGAGRSFRAAGPPTRGCCQSCGLRSRAGGPGRGRQCAALCGPLAGARPGGVGGRMNEPTAGSEAGGREPPGGGSAGRDTRARRQGAPERSAGPGRDPTAPRGGGAGRAEPRGQWEGARPPPLVPFPPSSCAAPAPETPAPGLCGPSPTRPGRRRAAARRDANGPAPARAAAARPRACKSRFPEPAHARRGSEETRGTQANLSSGWVPTF